MVTIGMNYQVLAGKERAFETRFEKVSAAMAALDGHVRTELFRSVHAENTYLVISEWTSEAAFQEFVSSEGFRKVTSWGQDNILSAHPRHQIWK